MPCSDCQIVYFSQSTQIHGNMRTAMTAITPKINLIYIATWFEIKNNFLSLEKKIFLNVVLTIFDPFAVNISLQIIVINA